MIFLGFVTTGLSPFRTRRITQPALPAISTFTFQPRRLMIAPAADGGNDAYRAVLNVTERPIVAPEIGLPIRGGLGWEEPEWDQRRFESI
jgi:hypothetical protein